MFRRKKEEKRRPNAGKGLSQYGLFDMPTDFENIGIGGADSGGEDDDGDLEAELLALTSGQAPSKPKRVRPPPAVDLNAMVAESLKDIPSDEEVGSEDENDPDLLEELSALHGEDAEKEIEEEAPKVKQASATSESSLVSLLEQRLRMYQEAESNAKSAGETSRARRFGRGIKTLNDMLKQARAGRVVNEADIPPEVTTTAGKKPPPPPPPESQPSDLIPEHAYEPISPTQPTETPSPVEPPAPTPLRPAPPPPPVPMRSPPIPARPPIGIPLPGLVSPTSEPPVTSVATEKTEESNTVNILKERQNQYKRAALLAKREGDNEKAIQYIRVAKGFEPVIAAVQEGKPVDWDSVPPDPSEITASGPISSAQKENSEKQSTTEETPAAAPEDITEAAFVVSPEAEAELYAAPPPPASVMEALEQRLNKYKQQEQAAKEEGNTSKARRMGRIVKQYESAIKMHKAGKPIPVDELPTPPGFAPIPVEGAAKPSPAASPNEEPAAAPAPAPAPAPRLKPAPPVPVVADPSSSNAASPSPPKKMNVRKAPQSRIEKQLSFLLARQKEFKEAALQAKRKGEINQAKEYLRLAKGFDPLIEASNCGLPVDMDTLPVPPDTKVVLESDFDFVTVDDCIPGSDAEIFEKLEVDLSKQAKMCLTTRDHFKAIGDVASANRFEQLAVHSRKDLDAVRCAHKRSEPIPKFHYETRSFSIVQCCTDLGDNDLELTIVQGINYTVPNPKEVDTYVKFEFPYPSEDPPKDRTALIKDTNNPVYNATFNLQIQRNLRACQRVFKRQSIKLEVWSRGGFFKSDSLIGTVNVKLLPLETKCIIHDSFDLMDGRKAVGGKLEIKVRIRNPILTKQVEQVQEKWLIIDRFM